MRPITQMVLLLVFLAVGCSGGGLTAPENSDREAAGIYGGRVTLNGSVTTDPSYKDQPYTFTFPGKSGEIALLTLSATAIPATNHPVLVKFRGATVNYGSMLYPSNGSNNYLPLYLTATETVTVTFYNTATSAPYAEAVTWNWSIRTRPAEDPREPNDDENEATITDRNLATPLSLDRQSSFSCYRRVAVPSTQDHEEWYRVDVDTLAGLHVTLGNSNGKWGTWRFDLRLYDAGGTLLAERRDIVETSRKWSIPALVSTGPYYIQLVATPVSKRGNSVYFVEYSLQPTLQLSWQIHGVAPELSTGISLTLHQGRPVIAYREGSDKLNIAVARTAMPSEQADWKRSLIAMYPNGVFRLISFEERLAVVDEQHLSISSPGFPDGPEDWTTSEIWTSHARELDHYGGRLVMVEAAEGQGYFLRALTPLPTGEADWQRYALSSNTLSAVDDSVALAHLDGRPAVALATSPNGDIGPSWSLTFARAQVAEPTDASQWILQTPFQHSTETCTADLGSNLDMAVHAGKFVLLFKHSISSHPVHDPPCDSFLSVIARYALDAEPLEGRWQSIPPEGLDWYAPNLVTGRMLSNGSNLAIPIGSTAGIQSFGLLLSDGTSRNFAGPCRTGDDNLIDLNGRFAIAFDLPGGGLVFAQHPKPW